MSDFTFLPPRPVRQADAVLFQTFDCGVQSLNGWLVRKALYNEIHGGSRTYVLSTSDGELAGFFAWRLTAWSMKIFAPNSDETCRIPFP